MASMSTSPGRRRSASRFTAEDQALNQISREAEKRLAARRAARNEAREIRMRELERQQREAEEKSDKHFEISSRTPSARVYTSKVVNDDQSEDSRELKKEVMELEDKYKKAMMSNAQLDNETQAHKYQVDLLKDQLCDLEEQHLELQREHKERCRELEQKKRDYNSTKDEADILKNQLTQRDELIEEYGLVYVESAEGKGSLVTPEAKNILEREEGSLDETLKKFAETKAVLTEEIKKLKQALEEEKAKTALSEKYPSPRASHSVNGPDLEVHNAQKEELTVEAQKQVNDYKYKLKKAEKDITELEGNVMRLESQVKRYRSSADNSEKDAEELKTEKRKLQRELRDAQAQIEDLNTQNAHLQKRIEKLRKERSALVK